ncbi:MAG: helix-turn-helix domain-containing protein [Candidatus Magasanikbacteria bacterium]
MDISIFKKIGLSDKAAQVYMALLQLGPSSVRKLAEYTEINRGTTYDILKELQESGVVHFFQKETKQQFVAENPEKIFSIIENKERELERTKKEIEKTLPELKALYFGGGSRPVAKYFSKKEIVLILEDVLNTCEQTGDKMYRIYSTGEIRKYLYKDFSDFSDIRIKKSIQVKVIAVGEGGELRGFDERKWLKVENKKPTYILIYPGKTAYISLDANGEPLGVVIENEGVCEMQKIIFDQLWNTL